MLALGKNITLWKKWISPTGPLADRSLVVVVVAVVVVVVAAAVVVVVVVVSGANMQR